MPDGISPFCFQRELLETVAFRRDWTFDWKGAANQWECIDAASPASGGKSSGFFKIGLY